MARRRRPIEGTTQVRSLMRRLPDAARGEIASVIERGSRKVLAAMIRRAPKRTGATRRGLTYRISRNGLSARIGLLGMKAGRNRLFYARIQDLGRRAQTVRVRRRRPGGGVSVYPMRVKAMTGKRFVSGSYGDLRRSIGDELRGIWPRILAKVGSGNG